MTTPNPYAADLLDRKPLEAFADTPFRLKTLVEGWDEADFERTYAPGKWPMRKVLIHLAQTELALSTRARHALSDDRYAAASFSQDDWLAIESGLDARTALEAYTTLRRMNVAMFRALSPAQLDRAFSHPEYGSLTVGWVLAQMAGHDIHHLKQFEIVAR